MIFQDLVKMFENTYYTFNLGAMNQQAHGPVFLDLLRRDIEKLLYARSFKSESDRRQFLRVPWARRVSYHDGRELRQCWTNELGERGLSVATGDPLSIGATTTIQVQTESQQSWFCAQAEVAWATSPQEAEKRAMGLKFCGLDPRQQELVLRLVNQAVRARLLERRVFPRMDMRLPGQLLRPEGNLMFMTENICASGLFLYTRHPFAVGSPAELLLQLPVPPHSLRIKARVARLVEDLSLRGAAGMALEVLDENQGVRGALQETLRQFLIESERLLPTKDERRVLPRLKRRALVRLITQDRDRYVFCNDISTWGVFVQTFEPPPMDSLLGLQFEHPDKKSHLFLSAKVHRVKLPYPSRPKDLPGASVRFHNLNRESRSKLIEFLNLWCRGSNQSGEDVLV